MKNRAYRTSIFRELRSSKARFLSIIVIIFLGVAFYAGVNAGGPAMQEAMEGFYQEQKLMDVKIVSTLGLTEKDIALLENNPQIAEYYASHMVDINVLNQNSVVRFMEYDKEAEEKMNRLVVAEGRLPEKSGEIVIDADAAKGNPDLAIGETYVVESNADTMDSLRTNVFTIVGYVNSPIYIDKLTRGTTTVGTGSLDYFVYIPAEDFDMEVYTELYVTFENVKEVPAYTDEYETKMEQNTAYVTELFASRQIERIEELKFEAYEEINEAKEKLADGEEKLAEGKQSILDGKQEIAEGKKSYADALRSYEEGIKEAEEQIASKEKELAAGEEELKEKEASLKEGKQQLEEAKKSLEQAKSTFKSQGVDPEQDLVALQSTIDALGQAKQQYLSLAEGMKETSSSLAEGEEVDATTIASWRAAIEQGGLTDLLPLINALEANPTDTATIETLAGGLLQASNSVGETKQSMETLLQGLTTYQSGKEAYEKNAATMKAGEEAIAAAKVTISNGKTKIKEAKATLEEKRVEGKQQLAEAKQKLEQGENDLIEGEKELKEKEQELKDGKAEIEEAEEKVSELDKGKYYVFDRLDNPGYAEFKDVIERMGAIASVFPLVFFIVAVLMCLTTMTRMVEENRTEIGTLKALGYTNYEISKKYIVYSAAASLIGSVLGILIGFQLFPNVITMAYRNQYEIPGLPFIWYPVYILQSVVLAISCTVGAALLVLKVDLASNPSALMRPKAPKVGKKILLERITPLWKRMNFNQKVTFRNLFRYKQRMLMTVFGITACTAMIVTGFGLKNSINDLTEKQFQKLWNYQAITILDADTSEEDQKAYETVLHNLPEYQDSIEMHQEMITLKKENMNTQNVTLYVPKEAQKLEEFVLLNDRRTGETYALGDTGAIINEKLAKLLNVGVGDTFSIEDDENNHYTMTVAAISESYLAHSVYVSSVYYEKIFGEAPTYNAQFIQLNGEADVKEDIANILMNCDSVINVSFVDTISSSAEQTMGSLNVVVVILIVAAGGLAFVVLYNLNNINVSERIRELSTIKVLGFYDQEVSMYIIRENIVLTILGIGVGMIGGRILHSFVIKTAESDNMMMSPNIFTSSYLYAAGITLLFSVTVMLLMHRKLKKVDMISALKSNE